MIDLTQHGLEFVGFLGQGAYGVVSRYWYSVPQTGQVVTVAVKQMASAKRSNQKQLYIERELDALRTTYSSGNRNLVKLLHHFEMKQSNYMLTFLVLEYCNGGTYDAYLNQEKKLEQAVVVYFARQLINGLRVLRLANLAHRDIKPENIFLHKEDLTFIKSNTDYRRIVLKIGDFGTCKRLVAGELASTWACGSLKYMAPEVVDFLKRPVPRIVASYDYKADMWSLGLVLFESLCGQEILEDLENDEELDIEHFIVKISHLHTEVENRVSSLSSELASETTKTFLHELLQRDVSRRLDFTRLEQHPFLFQFSPDTYK